MPVLKAKGRSFGELKEILADPKKHHLLSKEERAQIDELGKKLQAYGKTVAEQYKPAIEKIGQWSKVAAQVQEQTGATIKAMTAAFQPVEGIAQTMARLMEFRVSVPDVEVAPWILPEPIRFTPEMFERAPQRVYVENQDEIASQITAQVLTELRKEKEIEHPTPTNSFVSNDFFNPQTGTGVIKGKPVRMLVDRKPLRTFADILRNNGYLPRKKVIEVMDLETEKVGSEMAESIRSSNTYKINAVVKQIRESTHLDAQELVNSGGNLTLVRKIPVTDQNSTPPAKTD